MENLTAIQNSELITHQSTDQPSEEARAARVGRMWLVASTPQTVCDLREEKRSAGDCEHAGDGFVFDGLDQLLRVGTAAEVMEVSAEALLVQVYGTPYERPPGGQGGVEYCAHLWWLLIHSNRASTDNTSSEPPVMI